MFNPDSLNKARAIALKSHYNPKKLKTEIKINPDLVLSENISTDKRPSKKVSRAKRKGK